MKNLRYLDPPYIAFYNEIVASKNNTHKGKPNLVKSDLIDLREDVAQKYSHYEQKFHVNDLENIDPPGFSPAQKNTLKKAYVSSTKALDELKVKIKKAQDQCLIGKCPYCGVYKPSSFDHYIPKDEFPEYSVLALNLIPCCTRCNGKKSEYWKTDDGRRILNYYLDPIPTDQYLFASVAYKDGVPVVRFTLENRSNIPKEVFSIIEGHYARLGLFESFQEFYNDPISELKDAVSSFCSDSERTVLVSLIELYIEKKRAKFGQNHWETVLLEALKDCDEFIDSLI